jgi:hypothetical protein
MRMALALILVLAQFAGCGDNCEDETCPACLDGPINIELIDETDNSPVITATVSAGGAACEHRGDGHYVCPGEPGSTTTISILAPGYQMGISDTIVSLGDTDTEGCCNCPATITRKIQLRPEL